MLRLHPFVMLSQPTNCGKQKLGNFNQLRVLSKFPAESVEATHKCLTPKLRQQTTKIGTNNRYPRTMFWRPSRAYGTTSNGGGFESVVTYSNIFRRAKKPVFRYIILDYSRLGPSQTIGCWELIDRLELGVDAAGEDVVVPKWLLLVPSVVPRLVGLLMFCGFSFSYRWRIEQVLSVCWNMKQLIKFPKVFWLCSGWNKDDRQDKKKPSTGCVSVGLVCNLREWRKQPSCCFWRTPKRNWK